MSPSIVGDDDARPGTVRSAGPEVFFGAWAGSEAGAGGAELLGVLRTAERVGVLAAVGADGDAGDDEGRDADRMLAGELASGVLEVLEAFDVVEWHDGRARAKGPWTTLLAPVNAGYLHNALAYAWARARALDAIGAASTTYWAGDDEMRMAMATGVSVDPTDPAWLETMRVELSSREEYHRIASAGGDYLELGCGVAGGLLCQAQIYPAVRATGVELSADLAQVARERVELLGLGTRVEIIQGDVLAYDRPDSADLVFWSQFFFPGPSRAGALEVARRALRTGGLLVAPLLAPPAPERPSAPPEDHSDVGVSAEDPESAHERRDAALDRLVLTSWDIPVRSAEELVSEFARAGFRGATAQSSSFRSWVQATI